MVISRETDNKTLIYVYTIHYTGGYELIKLKSAIIST